MTEELEYDVFLSYSSKDKVRVGKLGGLLRDAGLKVWIDERDVKPGALIAQAVGLGLTKARKLLVCLSPVALESQWVQLEINAALAMVRSHESRRLVPVLLETCVLPPMLGAFSYVDLRTGAESEFQKLLADCRPEPSNPFSSSVAEDASEAPLLESLRPLSPRLRDELDAELEAYTAGIGNLGPESPDNEEAYIQSRREFLKNRPDLLEELLQRVLLSECSQIDLPAMEARHEIGRIFLEKRRGAEALEILGVLEAPIAGCEEVVRNQNRTTFSKMLDSTGEAIRFGPERDSKRARGLFEAALLLSPNDHFALKHLGTIHRIEGRYGEAETLFLQALAVKKTHHVHFSLGYLYSEWENDRQSNDKARTQYEACEQALEREEIHDYYRVYLKQAFLALRQHDIDLAIKKALQAQTVLGRCLPDDYVRVSRFAVELLLAGLFGDGTDRAQRLGRCERYLRDEIDVMSFAVFDCVYRDLKRELNAKESVLKVEVAGLRGGYRGLAARFDGLVGQLRLKESLLLRQKQNAALLRSGCEIETVFPRSDCKLVVYLKVLPGRQGQILPALEPFHDIQIAGAQDPYSLKLSFASSARHSPGALRQVSRALELFLDHAAVVALDKAASAHFPFDPSLWKPFTALVSQSLHGPELAGHFALSERYGGNDLVRIFSPKLVGADPGHPGKRVFLNPRVGCSVNCDFCYLPSYGIPIGQGGELRDYPVDIGSLGQVLRAKAGAFVPGELGTLLSIGSFTEPFLAPQATLDLAFALARDGNPVQIATRVFPGPEAVEALERHLGKKVRNVMINVSMNTPGPGPQGVISRWLGNKGSLNLAIYVKPFLDRTQNCFDDFATIGSDHPEVSFIVGSLYFGSKVGLSPDDVKNHQLEPVLKSPVVAHPTTPGMKNNGEESFRLRLEERLGRNVFRTSSCALAAKMGIPDPLGNFGGPFCVPGCENAKRCSEGAALPVPSA